MNKALIEKINLVICVLCILFGIKLLMMSEFSMNAYELNHRIMGSLLILYFTFNYLAPKYFVK